MEKERLEKIKELLMEQGTVYVDDLSNRFQVTTMTIRRDLSKLSAENPAIRRCRGGAMLVTDITIEATFPDKSVMNIDAKETIVRRALPLIQEGQTIYLDAGTTCYELAKLLIERPVPVEIVTNDLRTAYLLSRKNYSVLVTGGGVERETGCLIGNFAESTLRMIHIDLAFLGATSIDENFVVSTPTQDKAFMKRLVLAQSGAAYLLVDQSKFYHRSRYPIYRLDALSGIFTDKVFSGESLDLMEKYHIRLMK